MNNYSGIMELTLDDPQLAKYYEGSFDFTGLQPYINEYIFIKNINGEIVDKCRWTETGAVKLKYKTISNSQMGKIKSRNPQQDCALDALQNEDITGILLVGGFGSGKTMLTIAYAIDQIINGSKRYDKIVFLRNNYEIRNSVPLGALPGTLTQKIKPYAMSIADILGSEIILDQMIEEGKIVLEHIGFIRGRSYKNTLVILSEAQDCTREHMGLIVARIGEGSRLLVEGDFSQCDKAIFEKDSGIYALAEGLKGDKEFAMVTLNKNERSRFASLSDQIINVRNK